MRGPVKQFFYAEDLLICAMFLCDFDHSLYSLCRKLKDSNPDREKYFSEQEEEGFVHNSVVFYVT